MIGRVATTGVVVAGGAAQEEAGAKTGRAAAVQGESRRRGAGKWARKMRRRSF